MTILDTLGAVLRRTFRQPNLVVSRSTSAADVPGWDSLNHLFLVMELEAEFDVDIAADEVARLPDIGALADLVAERLARKDTPS
nr:acyl carrier protein [uncultured Roseococcus sp.]